MLSDLGQRDSTSVHWFPRCLDFLELCQTLRGIGFGQMGWQCESLFLLDDHFPVNPSNRNCSVNHGLRQNNDEDSSRIAKSWDSAKCVHAFSAHPSAPGCLLELDNKYSVH